MIRICLSTNFRQPGRPCAPRRCKPRRARSRPSRSQCGYAEGRGIAVNYGEAAKWYDRAAQKGIVPAMFRLGTILEKGLNGKKDVDGSTALLRAGSRARNAKAMHNLAVLDADGGGKGPNYKSAAVWFRKAADHGIR